MEAKPKFGPEQYPAGTDIIRQGDIPEKFYIITAGEVEIVRHYAAGYEIVIDRMGEGSYFGEIGLLKKAKRIATVRAKTDVQVMSMGHDTFERWLSSSQVSRDEVDAVMQERLTLAGELQPVDAVDRFTEEEHTAVPTATEILQAATPAMAGQQHYAPGDIIIRQGDPADQYYIIVEGTVEVFHHLPQTGDTPITRLDSGNYFGEIGLLEGSKRTASVRAITPVKLLAFDRETFSRWISHAPASRYELWRTASERRDNTKPLPPIGGIPSVDTPQMIEVDRAMIEDYRIDLLQMMENAGRNLAHLARRRFLNSDPRGQMVVVLAGRGGNGGGGLVCARRLHNWGARVHVFITNPDEAYTGVPAHQLEILRRMGLPVTIGAGMVLTGLLGVDLIIDALIGYNLADAPRGAAAQFIRWANVQNVPILSLDVPSGLDTTTGKVYNPAIRASATMTLALPKEGLRHETGEGVVGELYLADIGVPPDLYAGPKLELNVGPVFAEDDIIRLA
ncbi:MAG: NAD(P)H-hydrate epimerase [Chloroflexi bacterium]|nr:NAD(P)H-hydrate epimerase [Chloroflexota bacterium]